MPKIVRCRFPAGRVVRCRFPAGRGGITQRYFDEFLGREGAADMIRSGQQRGDREREAEGARYNRSHSRNLTLLTEEMTSAEKEIAKRAVNCYNAGGMVLWDRTPLSGLRRRKRSCGCGR